MAELIATTDGSSSRHTLMQIMVIALAEAVVVVVVVVVVNGL